MLTKSKIALSLALVLGSASVAIAAPKHQTVRHRFAIERLVPTNAYRSFVAVSHMDSNNPRWIDDPQSPGG